MKILKTALLSLLMAQPLVLSTQAAGQSSLPRDLDAPKISPVHCRFLTQLVRRTIAARLNEEGEYHADYVPPALATVECQVVVTLRQHGFARGIGVSMRKPVAEAAYDAARLALSSARADPAIPFDSLADIYIEMQALGDLTPYVGEVPWTSPGALATFLDPGLDGIGIYLDGEQRWFTPGEMISKNLSFTQAVNALAKEISLDSRAVPEGKLSKFRTLHWWEVNEKGEVVILRRGLVPLPPEVVNRDALEAAIARLGRYLIFRQQPDGRFAYAYNPATDSYALDDDEVAQSGAAWALAAYATHTGDRAVLERSDQAIEARMRQRVTLPNMADASIITAPDGINKLGITAQMCLALADAPRPERFAKQRAELVRAMAWLQRPTGKIIPDFPPSKKIDEQDVFPGQALAALARCYQLEPSDEIRVVVERGFEFYRPYYDETGSPVMVPWHTQAFAIMAERTKRRAYADFVFAMSDQVCAHQLTPENCASPELWGAVAMESLPPDAFTAAYVWGLAQAARLADGLGEEERAERYTRACRLGARFVMQLQVRAEEGYYMRSLNDAVDGVRCSPLDARIRVDSCQYALLALIAARDLLFPNQP